MNFKVRKIRKEPKRPKKNPFEFLHRVKSFNKPIVSKNKYTLHIATITGSILVILVLVFGIYTVIKSLDFSSIVFSFGKTLLTDEHGRTNIMLIGAGGEGHDGANLTDTIILASIDYENKVVPMISIPRDFYIISNQYGNQRINSVYDTFLRRQSKAEGIQILKEIVGEITGTEIQYYAFVNFQGFEDIVDSLDGVEILVENDIYDPYYPKGETIYFETFKLKAGLQQLDGATALKYARSRKTTSDFDRAKRQQKLMYAIKDRALSMEILTNPNKIKSLYDSVAGSIDTNLSLAEILELAKFAEEFNKDDIFPAVLNDDPNSCGGLLYTPAREYFDGASVLLPAGKDYSPVQQVVSTLFNHTKTVATQEEIQVLNGTKTPGLAGVTMNLLLRNCLNVTYYGNASDRSLTKSTIYYKPGPEGEEPVTLSLIKELVPLPVIAGIPPEYTESAKRQNATIVIELGIDYLDLKPEEPFNTLKFLTAPASTKPATSDDTADTDSTTIKPTDSTSSSTEISKTPEPVVTETLNSAATDTLNPEAQEATSADTTDQSQEI